MGIVITNHPKFLERLVSIWRKKHNEEGAVAAQEYANRTFTPEIVKELIPIIHKGNEKK